MAYRFTAAATGLIPTAVKTAIEAAGSKLATIEQATVTDIPTKIDNIEVATDAPSVAEIRAEMDANSTKLASINLATTDTIPTAIGNVSATVDETALAAAIAGELGSVVAPTAAENAEAYAKLDYSTIAGTIPANSPMAADMAVLKAKIESGKRKIYTPGGTLISEQAVTLDDDGLVTGVGS